MKLKVFSLHKITGAALAFLLLLSVSARAADTDLKLEAQLIWGSNEAPAKDATNNLVGSRIEKKLKRLPFKWEHYYVVNTQVFTAPPGETKKVKMSGDCEIVVKNTGDERVELSLIGKGKPVGKITQSLRKGQTLVTGGNAENLTGWFIVLRQVD
jgi:hypothetical protein